ncbi:MULTISPECIES: cupin domain-containing protein [Pseudomonas]|uniref:cupin domain-containing protein n=1 Tax=Pseudomonas TaxID=286 RepID=UPI0012FD5EAF|nr:MULTISPECIES: cupin domain-containing protein [Pseudomonas]WLG65589.1 cupin domain-containing protein [Pseudomonas brassicacearum]
MESTFAVTCCCTRRVKAFSSTPYSFIGVRGNAPRRIFRFTGGIPQGTLELFHVEKGTLKCLVGETELVIPAGSSAVAKTDVPHSYSNAGRSKLVFTMSVTEMHQ